MKTGNLIYITALIILAFGSGLTASSVKKIGDVTVDSKALTLGEEKFGKVRFGDAINGCSFQQEAIVTHEGYQYVGYYDGNRQVCIARRELPIGAWETIRFKGYQFKNNDAHNTISIGISPKDATIHIAFDHHVDALHYRVSRKGTAANPEKVKWEASLFSPILSELEKGKEIKVTYPRFWQTPDGSLQFCYRQGGSGNGDRMLVDYDPETGSWKNSRQIDSREGQFEDGIGTSDSRCSYPNGYTYGPHGRLHTTWVWREHSQGANHDLIYVYSEDGGNSWLNNEGKTLSGPARVDSPGITVVNIDRKYGLMNTHGQAVDSQGRIHTVMWHCSDESLEAVGVKPGEVRFGPTEARRYFHYWRMADGTWHERELPGVAGNRPKLFIDEANNTYLIFMRAGDLVIMNAQADGKWADWKVIHQEKGPFLNEMLGDFYRWKESGILSVMVQESPKQDHESTPLRIIDFQL